MAWYRKANTGIQQFQNPKELLMNYRRKGSEMLPELIEFVSKHYGTSPEEAKNIISEKTLPIEVIQQFMKYMHHVEHPLLKPSYNSQQYSDIAGAYLNTRRSKNEMQAYILLGLPGSGKSTYADAAGLIDPNKIGGLEIDVDLFKPYSHKYSQGYGASLAHPDSMALGDVALTQAANKGSNLVLPLVGANANYIEGVIHHLKKLGYTVHIKYLHLDHNNAVNRAKERYETTKRYVPLEYISGIANQPFETYNKMKNLNNADSFEDLNALDVAKQRPHRRQNEVHESDTPLFVTAQVENNRDKKDNNEVILEYPFNEFEEWEETVLNSLKNADQLLEFKKRYPYMLPSKDMKN